MFPVQGAYQATTGGKFSDAVTKFREILLSLSLLVVDNRSELEEVRVRTAQFVCSYVHTYQYVYNST